MGQEFLAIVECEHTSTVEVKRRGIALVFHSVCDFVIFFLF